MAFNLWRKKLRRTKDDRITDNIKHDSTQEIICPCVHEAFENALNKVSSFILNYNIVSVEYSLQV